MSNIIDYTRRFVELVPCGSRQSFYGKAKVYEDSKGNKWLISYDTLIAVFTPDKVMHRLWSGWSATSGRHFATFCDYVNHMWWENANKKYWDSLPVENPNDFE